MFNKLKVGGGAAQVQAQAQAPAQGGEPLRKGDVALYEHADFKGKVWLMHENLQDFTTAGVNDVISSLKLGPETIAVLYEHANYGGKELHILQDLPNLVNHNFNDIASSIKIHPKIAAAQPANIPPPVTVPSVQAQLPPVNIAAPSIAAPVSIPSRFHGSYTIVNASTGKGLDSNVHGAPQLDSSHPRIFVWESVPSANNHQWEMRNVEAEWYTISPKGSNLALDGNVNVPQVASSHPAPFLWERVPNAHNHQWKFQELGTNTYVIINRANGLALDGNVAGAPQHASSHPSPFLWTPVPEAKNHQWVLQQQ